MSYQVVSIVHPNGTPTHPVDLGHGAVC